MAQTRKPDLSVIIPARNEAENLPVLIGEVKAALAGRTIEIIVVNDGSSDDTQAVLEALATRDPAIRVLRHEESFGKSRAEWSGVMVAGAERILTLDGDGENDPAFLPALMDGLNDPGIGLVAGQRTTRHDGALKLAASRIANRVRSALLGDATRDSGCGLKAYRRDAYLALPYFDGMHRFLPALFKSDGWDIAHIDVVGRPRQSGSSNYGILDRLGVGVVDLFGVWWLVSRRARRPKSMQGKTPS